MSKPNSTKDLYRELRKLSCAALQEEIRHFNQAAPQERIQRVALIRAVGVVFSESATEKERQEIRQWLLGLLNDPHEKIRRYAMAALPKIGSGLGEETALLGLLRKTEAAREKGFLFKALNKIGGEATLGATDLDLDAQTEQKLKANVARGSASSVVRLNHWLRDFSGLQIHLRCRSGLEEIVRVEVEENARKKGKFRIGKVSRGLVVIRPITAFALSDLYALRCFGTVGFVLGTRNGAKEGESPIPLAIASEFSKRVLEAFTEGPLRYRVNFLGKGESKKAIVDIANRVYAICPSFLNDSRSAPWSVDIYPPGQGGFIELRPRLTPDPRLAYRQEDIPAASHPPLAACMARLGGRREGEIVWDPFCGSGLELIERALLGGVDAVFGTDHSQEALRIAQRNFSAAGGSIKANFACCNFRDFASVKGLDANSVTLLITNPPLGRRIPIPNLRGLIEDLFKVASEVLRPGGRLVFANPLRVEPRGGSLKLQFQQVVDFGGFNCRLEKYVKSRS